MSASTRPLSIEATLGTLHALPSNKARERALQRMLQDQRPLVCAVAEALGMKLPPVFDLTALIKLARLIQKKGGSRE